MTDGPDMNDLLRQAMAMQEQLMAAQEQARQQTVAGSAGGGLVRITMAGSGDVTNVEIDADAIDPSDPELLEDLVLAAFRDAQQQVARLQQAAMGGLPGLDALGLGGLGELGGPPEGG